MTQNILRIIDRQRSDTVVHKPKFGEEVKEVDTEAGWQFHFVKRAFREVLLIEKDHIPKGYINLDGEEEINFWKKVAENAGH